MTTSIYVVSYARDYPWLEFLFRSIAKHCTGFLELIIAVPETDIAALEKMFPCLAPGATRTLGIPFPVHPVVFDDSEYPDKHMSAMEARLNADLYITGDLCLNVDSDCVWIEPTTPDLFIDKNKWAINLFSNFKMVNGKEWPSHWRACTEKALGEPVTAETMRRHPGIFWRDTYMSFRKHIEKVHGKSLAEYLRPLKRGAFSEFCALGAFAMAYEPGYEWIEAESAECPVNTLHQFWSFHTVHNSEVQAKLKELDFL